jgi:hypothetical protein
MADRWRDKVIIKLIGETMSKELSEQTLESFKHLKKAIDDLGVAVKIEADDGRMVIDATLHRAKVALEVFWSLLQELAIISGEDAKTPQDALVAAGSFGWLHNEEVWLKIIGDSAQIPKAFKNEDADQIYNRLSGYHEEIKLTYDLLAEKFLG